MTGIGKWTIALLPVFVTITGCGAPDRLHPETEITIPDDWSAQVDTGADDTVVDWWRTLGDDRLDTLIQEALRSNQSLVAAAMRLEAAAAEAKIAGAELWPQLNAAFSASRSRTNLIGIPIPGAPDPFAIRSNSFGVNLASSWEVDLWGRVRKQSSAASALYQSTAAEVAGARLSIASAVARAWFALTEARLQAELASETARSYRRSLDRIDRRYSGGVAPSIDVRIARSQLAAAESRRELAESLASGAARQLEILLGRYPKAVIAGAGHLPESDGSPPAGIPAEIVTRRPDLAAAERRLAAASAAHGEAKRALLPRITLTASGGRLSDEIEDLLDGNFKVWSVAGNLLQPLFQGGRLRANVKRSGALADAALADYASTLLSAFAEVERALEDERRASAREEYLSTAAVEASAARRLADRQYAAGLGNYLYVLETRRQELLARSELLQVRRLRLDARINLHVALGGGFDSNHGGWEEYLAPSAAATWEENIETP